MANFCTNNGYSFPAPAVSSPIYTQFNGTNMATTMHQHLVHFTPPTVRNNTALQAGTSEPACSGAKWQQGVSMAGVPWSSQSSGCNVTPTTIWQHTVPSSMPWVGSPHIQNIASVYTFNGLPPPLHPTAVPIPRRKESRPPPACQRRCKRKCDTSMEYGQDQPREKVFVNEERMAARLEQLQIDNNNLDWHPNLEQEAWYSQQRTRPKTLQEMDDRLSDVEEENESENSSTESDSDTLPRLEMSELLKVGIKTKEILPQLIMDEMNKSNMQIVLWKPPEHFVKDVIKNVTTKNSDAVDMAEIEVGNPSGLPNLLEGAAAAAPVPARRGASTPVPDLLIEAAQIANNNNTTSAASNYDPDVWQLMTSTPLPDADLDFTFDDDDMDL